MKRSDSGYILPMTLVTITLIAFAALLTGRTFAVQLRASMQERLIIEERLASRNAEHIMDAWMADPVFSKDITEHSNGADLWRKPDGSLGCSPPTDSTCWQFTVTDPTTNNPTLRGGEAEQDIRDITVEIKSGCFLDIDRCQRIAKTDRIYERAVTIQYQLHYENHNAPDAAFNGPDGVANPTECETEPVPEDTVCDDPRPDLRADLPLPVVFTSEDTLNGPLRYSGDGAVQFCGSATFKLIESRTDNLPSRAGDDCLLLPSWLDDGTPQPWPTSYTTADDLGDRFVVKGDELALPTISTPQGCALSTVNYHHIYDDIAKSLRGTNLNDDDPTNDCPGNPSDPDHAILDGDIITSTGSVTIERLVVEGSVTVYAEGDIIVCGDIEASGTNPAGGPNAVALITEAAVILDPSGSTPPSCNNGTLTELTPAQNLTLTNVAVLAPGTNGAVYARGWHLLCDGTCPTFTLKGSIAATHLGLYGIPNPSGGVTNGWSKEFTYPTDFWRARPPWWPDFTGHEWAPA